MLDDSRTDIASIFKALGDPTRLQIFDLLRGQCCAVALGESGEVRRIDGPTVGEVCCRVTGAERINSTISHHLKELRLANLITVERRGKNMICGVNWKSVESVRQYFEILAPMQEDCCGPGERVEDE